MPLPITQCFSSLTASVAIIISRWTNQTVRILLFGHYGLLHCTVMPFCVKNVGATYQRSMNAISHDMLQDCLEDYLDIIIKSKEACHHLDDLMKVFTRCRWYNLLITL